MEKRRMGLDALRPGEYGVLREILMPGEAKARMEELGLLPETELSCLYRAPHASPAAYAVGGAVFALRKKDAAQIVVEAVPRSAPLRWPGTRMSAKAAFSTR